MIHLDKKLDKLLLYPFQTPLDQIIFFDIETTGFLPDISSVYLIGCSYYYDNFWHLKQWFADDYISESTLIQEFFRFLENFRILIHYNGSGFDIPYLVKKCRQYNLSYNFTNIVSIDLYKVIKPLKKYIQIENLKLKTVEQYLDISRKDLFDGEALIELYGNYIKGKYMRDSEINNYLEDILLHNEEDIINLFPITRVLAYRDILNHNYHITEITINENILMIQITLNNSFPFPICIEHGEFLLSISNDSFTIKVSCLKGELKFFFDNYKDYYYLIHEDMAVHKSVAIYVDKEAKTKAKASNCYIKKTSTFIPQIIKQKPPCFKNDYKDSITYIEINDDFLQDDAIISQYVNHIIKYLLEKD